MDRSGPAFPEVANSTSGLTKRELFAALAMLACVVNRTATLNQFANDAVGLADALLAELAKGEGA